MASVHDVAQYILASCGPMTTMKLQKLVYYSQAWSVVWDDDVIFPETIQAWENGPVVRELWETTRGQFRISDVGGDPDVLTQAQKETVNKVIEAYGCKNAQWLSDLTHMERPWQDAYERYQNAPITPEALSEYYSSLTPSEAEPV